MPKDSKTETIRHNFRQPTPTAGEGHKCTVPGRGPSTNPTLSAGKGASKSPNASAGRRSTGPGY